MTEQDGDRFTNAMLALAEVFKNPVSERLTTTYYESLKDLTIEQFETAAQHVIDTGRFFPKPVELREAVEGNQSDEAALAFAEFQQEVSRVGYMRTPSLQPATMEAVRLVFGGWRQACASLPSPDSDRAPELMNWRKQFVAAYANNKRREAIGALTDGEAKNALADISAWRAKQLRGESA